MWYTLPQLDALTSTSKVNTITSMATADFLLPSPNFGLPKDYIAMHVTRVFECGSSAMEAAEALLRTKDNFYINIRLSAKHFRTKASKVVLYMMYLRDLSSPVPDRLPHTRESRTAITIKGGGGRVPSPCFVNTAVSAGASKPYTEDNPHAGMASVDRDALSRTTDDRSKAWHLTTGGSQKKKKQRRNDLA